MPNTPQIPSLGPEYLHTVVRERTIVLEDRVEVAAIDPGEAEARVRERNPIGHSMTVIVDKSDPVTVVPTESGPVESEETLSEAYRNYLQNVAADRQRPVGTILSYAAWEEQTASEMLIEKATLLGIEEGQLHEDVREAFRKQAEACIAKGLPEQVRQLYHTYGYQSASAILSRRVEFPLADPSELFTGCPFVDVEIDEDLCHIPEAEEDPDYDRSLVSRR